MAEKKKIDKKLLALIIAGIVFFAIAGLHLLGVFHFLEYKSYDMRVRFWADTSYSRPSDEIAVILLEQDSLDWAQQNRGWGWPWPRQAYAEIVNYMNFCGANAVAFDVIFSEPSVYRNSRQDEIIDNAVLILEEAESEGINIDRPRSDSQRLDSQRTDSSRTDTARNDGQRTTGGQLRAGETSSSPVAAPAESRSRSVFRVAIEALRSLSSWEDDAAFIESSNQYGNVVQTVMFSTQTGSALSWPTGLYKPVFQPNNFGSMLDNFGLGSDMKAQFPIQGLIDSAGALGSVTGIPDSDGIIRRLKPFTLFDGNAIPGLSAASLLVAGKDNQLNFNRRNNTINWEGVSIPVDKDGNAILRYRGVLDKYIPYRAMDILLSYEAVINGDESYINSDFFLKPENFRDTYVFFGFYAQGLFDIFNTPISSVYAGMGCHITMLDNMLQNDFIRESTEFLNLFILLAIVIITVAFCMFIHRIAFSVGGTILIVAAVVISAFAAYQFGGLWLPMITFLAGTLVSFVTVTLYNYAIEGSQKRFIKSAFSQYLSPKVIDQLILDPSKLKLGGENKQLTAVFTDIRAFSTFSEALGNPEKLVELLNFYLTRMSTIILNHEGTIDKYIGDAIVSFFGAPMEMSNHASVACRTAVMMKREEKVINREVLEKGLINEKVMEALFAKGKIRSLNDPCPVYTRLGINSGDMVVGNMGTHDKMDYTIMGNAVNLAARLEGVNDQYDTGGILISEYTKALIGSEFIVRSLSRVRVVGINTPLRLFELLDISSEASDELKEMVKNWEKAFESYEQKDFMAAQEIFQTIYDNNNNDLAALKYLNRCVDYISQPPDDKKWDGGVDTLTSK